MPFPPRVSQDTRPLLDRFIEALSVLTEDNEAVDVATFAESPQFLGITLYPRQRLILKLYYRVPLSDEEFDDVKMLLSCSNKYARLYFPNICQHHITGECEKRWCHDWSGGTGVDGDERRMDYRILEDYEIRERLISHGAHILEVIAGRRGSKSLLGAVVNAYELYKMLREGNPQVAYGLIPGVPIGTANVATDETQALILFNQLRTIIDNSEWFKRTRYRSLETLMDFPGRGVFARSMHSNSASVRGNTLIAVFIDEYCFFQRTDGKMSDKAMWAAIAPSIVTFGKNAHIIITSSPLNKSGVAWDFFHEAEEHRTRHIIAFQFSTWEMNPTIDPILDPEISRSYAFDKVLAEMEYGGQWTEQVGQYIPPEAVEACANRERRMVNVGERGVKYTLHVDMAAKRDRCGLCITHYDRELDKVIVDRVEEFDPKVVGEKLVNQLGEIDHEEVFQYIVDLNEVYRFRFQSITFDQFQSEWLVQALRKKFGEDCVESVHISDKTNREMFGNLRTAIVQGGIEYYRHPELILQLKALSMTVRDAGGWKVEAPPGMHDDLADALAMSCLRTLQLAMQARSGIEGLRIRPKLVSHPDGAGGEKHLDSCSKSYCAFGCPVQEARMR